MSDSTTETTETAATTGPTGSTEEGSEVNETTAGTTDEGTEENGSGNKEAAKYRRQLREAEGERDALQNRLAAFQRGEAERLAAEHLVAGEALWLGATELDSLLDDDGNLDPEQVKADGSNEPLFSLDPTQSSRRVIEGRPLFVSPAVAEGTVWGIPKDRVYVVIRRNYEVTTDRSIYFTSDSLGVRATLRIGFGYPHPEALVKVTAE